MRYAYRNSTRYDIAHALEFSTLGATVSVSTYPDLAEKTSHNKHDRDSALRTACAQSLAARSGTNSRYGPIVWIVFRPTCLDTGIGTKFWCQDAIEKGLFAWAALTEIFDFNHQFLAQVHTTTNRRGGARPYYKYGLRCLDGNSMRCWQA
eukprot:6189150-Pleurochrysis_carterae.AAC.1